MSTPCVLLRDARCSAEADVAGLRGQDDQNEAFAAWLLGDQAGLSLSQTAHAAAAKSGAQRTYRECAVLGFAADSFGSDYLDPLRTNLTILVGREAIVAGEQMPFCTDPIALLGIALGARSLGPEALSTTGPWMSKVLSICHSARGLESWQRCILAAAANVFPAAGQLEFPDTPEVADVRLALRAKGIVVSCTSEDDDTGFALAALTTIAPMTRDPIRAAINLAALSFATRSLPTVVPARVTVNEVITLLTHVEPALRRWTWEAKPRTPSGTARQWHVDNEYHVQNLLFALLRPVFPDLDDEEYTKKIGPKQPRADLSIPSLRLLIEVKFWRRGEPASKPLGEIAQDASQYLAAGSTFSHIVAFVWDDAGRGDEHDRLRSGLCSLPGVAGAVVVSRPGRFV